MFDCKIIELTRKVRLSYHLYFLNAPATEKLEQEEARVVEFLPEPSRLKVSALTEEDLKSGRYTIHDIVLPLPGYDVVYPDNEFKDYYKTALAADGLDINNMRNKVRDYALSGAYRSVSC